MTKLLLRLSITMLLMVNLSHAGSLSCYKKHLYIPPDSNKLIQIPVSQTKELNTGEVFISPGIGYGDMTILGSPIDNSTFNYNNSYYNATTFNGVNYPEFGVSLDYLASQLVGIGIGINYQELKYTLANNSQNTYPNYYSYPNSVLFSRLNIGMRNLFYFGGNNSDNLHLYVGIRTGLSIWNEADDWSNGVNSNNYYRPVISSLNNTHLSLQLLWGLRYFFTPDFGTQLELGLGTPYYAQFGITIRLNDNPVSYSVTRSEYRAMNEGSQLTHRDSVNLGLLHPQPTLKK